MFVWLVGGERIIKFDLQLNFSFLVLRLMVHNVDGRAYLKILQVLEQEWRR